jgi:hypothetical protein
VKIAFLIPVERRFGKRRLRRAAGCALVLLLLSVPASATAGVSCRESYVVLGPGTVGVLDEEQALFGVIEVRPGVCYGPLGPWVGVHADEEAAYVAAGLQYEWFPTNRVFLIPSFGVGVVTGKADDELGHPLEFRSGIEAGIRFGNGHRLAVGFGHVSNGGIDHVNPGTELLALLYALPVSWPGRAP